LRVLVRRSRVSGRIRAPQSKSYAIRLVFASLLADIALEDLVMSGDVLDAIDAVRIFGVEFDGARLRRPESIAIRGNRVFIRGSATVLRMLIPIAAVVGGRIEIDGSENIRRRPIKAVVDALRSRGVRFSRDSLPTVMEGRLADNYVEISGAESSQYISGFMVAFALAGGGTIDIVPPTVSREYIRLTADVLSRLGVRVVFSGRRIDVEVAEKPRGYSGKVPGDFLLASFYVASALLTGGSIEVYNLSSFSGGPHRVVEIYREMGARSSFEKGVWRAEASDSYRGIAVDAVDDPDLVPSIVPLAAIAKGTTVVRGVSNLRIKESDRVESIVSTLRSFGLDARAPRGEALYIVGGEPSEARAVCPNDHRIAMMFTSIAVRSGGILDKAECVDKSNPGFWSDMRFLGADIRMDG